MAPVQLRPPKWEKHGSGHAQPSFRPLNLEPFKRQQQRQLAEWRGFASDGQWRELHNGHFDWWMFPIDDGSQPQYNVRCEADIAHLLADAEWADGMSGDWVGWGGDWVVVQWHWLLRMLCGGCETVYAARQN
ncbi:hypothetical protein T492DRAFT_836959 [Pavlovales sp. CCMP2436]|nr:hypothetical protein T492DRAFT_836959 [Pavlovales sp. CCMP2436]